VASEMTGGDASEEGEGGGSDDGEASEEPSGSANYSIARRVNARRPSTTATGSSTL